VFSFADSFGGSKEILRPVGVGAVENPSHNSNIDRGFKSGVSSKNLLGLDRPTPFSLPTSKRGMPLGSASVATDTVNVLVLKVEFQREIQDNPNTTGDGTFDMRSYEDFYSEEGHYIDPAPHTSSYFNSHMEALRRYWYFVSEKQLSLTWDIYPNAESLAYRLPEQMSYYGSDGPWDSIVDRLTNFFIDAITYADTSTPGIDFSRYQSIIVFHAGSDQQNNIAFIYDTPDDFYTGFLVMGDPILVDNGLNTVSEGLIMPETASQDNRVTAINGVMAHEFGHQLGLVDLYNTSNFMTQVGDFALMDNNGMSVGVQFPDIRPTVGGTLPVYPCAWSRAYLGFDMPRNMISGTDIPISATALNYDSTEIVKVPITDFEYYLVENRAIDADTLEPGYPFDNILIGDSLTGVILGPGYAYFEGNDTVLVADAEYDRLLPGSGALIWHVDELVAYMDATGSGGNNFLLNTLQWDKTRRFMSVVEADGVIDFGGNYHRGFGTYRDMYRVGTNTSFTPFTNPASISSLGGDTHINMTGFSSADTIMTFDLDIDWSMPGWPQMTHPEFNSSPIAVDIDADGLSEVLSIADNRLLIHRSDGSKYFDSSDSIGFYQYDNRLVNYPWAVAAICNSTLTGRPIPFDIDGDGHYEIAVASDSGTIYAFTQFDDNFDGRADPVPGFPVQISDTSLISLSAVNYDNAPGMELLAVAANGEILGITGADSIVNYFNTPGFILSVAAYNADGMNILDLATKINGTVNIFRIRPGEIEPDQGQNTFDVQLGSNNTCYLASGDIDRDGGLPEIVAAIDNSVILIEPDGTIGWRIDLGTPLGKPALGDINSDGYVETVVAGNGRIFAIGYNGALLTDFPVNMLLYDKGGEITAQPVLGDIDGDNNPDIIVGLPGGGIYAVNSDADFISGFPLPSSFFIDRAGALADIDNDGDTDLLTIEGSGAINAWDISTDFITVNNPWPTDGGDIFNSGYLAPTYSKPVITNDQQLPAGSVYNYPNPASNSTAIRFYVSNAADIGIDIFDMMGDKVESVKMRGTPHSDNEYVWDCSGVASGVYFCKVEANDGTGKESRMIKIALVK